MQNIFDLIKTIPSGIWAAIIGGTSVITVALIGNRKEIRKEKVRLQCDALDKQVAHLQELQAELLEVRQRFSPLGNNFIPAADLLHLVSSHRSSMRLSTSQSLDLGFKALMEKATSANENEKSHEANFIDLTNMTIGIGRTVSAEIDYLQSMKNQYLS